MLKRWQDGDYTERTSLLNFPTQELEDHIPTTFLKLKKRQAQLFGDSLDGLDVQPNGACLRPLPPP